MRTLQLSLIFMTALLLNACVGDDFVDDAIDPVLRITSNIDTIQVGELYQLEATYLNNIGQEENVELIWESSNPDILSIDNSGLANPLKEGNTTITATLNDGTNSLSDQIDIVVGQETVVQEAQSRTGSIQVTSNYILEGNFELSEENGGLKLSIDDSYKASAGLPGLYIYLTNNPTTISNAYEIGMVNTFEGAHEFIIADNVGINDYSHVLYFCKPFNIKIGDGEFVN